MLENTTEVMEPLQNIAHSSTIKVTVLDAFVSSHFDGQSSYRAKSPSIHWLFCLAFNNS